MEVEGALGGVQTRAATGQGASAVGAQPGDLEKLAGTRSRPHKVMQADNGKTLLLNVLKRCKKVIQNMKE